jgi:uncharacterized protein YihD (DUF1040 family)
MSNSHLKTMSNSPEKHQKGLDLKEAKTILEEFLKPGNDSKVLALKGDWGVGKTHLVKACLSQTNQSYHYGSVFGISKIEELKMQLWSNFNSGNKADEKTRTGIFKWILGKSNEKSNELKSILESIPKAGDHGLGVAPTVITLTSSLLINKALQDKIICIDDLERKSENLSLNEVLGFIEDLTEDKNCKVIIIYNDSKLQEDKDYDSVLKSYREKVIDFEIKLDPSLADNFHIGFGRDYPDKDFVFDYLNRSGVRVNNIRILKRIKLNLDKVRPYISSFLPRVKRKIIDEVIFLTLAQLDSNFAINLNQLISLGSYQDILRTEGDRDIYLQAIQLGYTQSIISNEIFRLVETSVCDYKRIQKEGERLNDLEKNHEIEQKINEISNLFTESFADYQEVLKEALSNFLDNHCQLLGYSTIQELAGLSDAVKLDASPYWERWLQYQIDQTTTLKDLYSLRLKVQSNNSLGSSESIVLLNGKISAFEKDLSIDKVLIKVMTEKGWSPQDADYLNSHTLDQWKKWLCVKNPDKLPMVRQGLNMSEDFSRTLKEAIVELAEINDLNKMRAKKLYGVVSEKV